MKIAFYGSSLLSCYWNGAATYYRGLLCALAKYKHQITFYEPDAFDRQAHRDIDPPEWAEVRVYPANSDAVNAVMQESADADVVIKASGVGVFDDELLTGLFAVGKPSALRIFWDVDAPATIEALRAGRAQTLRAILPSLDLVLTYGGGSPVVDAYRELGATCCTPIYNALDRTTHYPVPPESGFLADLSLLANRLPDRESRVEEFFLRAATILADSSFILGGAGWYGRTLPANVRAIGHVPARQHNAFNCSPRAVLNIARESMAATGFSPATRIFEAAGAGACLITDAWEGIELFLKPGEEIIVVRDGKDVAACLSDLDPARAKDIGQRARSRILAEHTYDRRAAMVDMLLREMMMRKVVELVA